MTRWRQRLGDHELSVIFVIRLLPLVRMYITVATGLMRVRLRHFLLGAAPAGLIWAGAPLVVGFVFRGDVHRWEARYTTTSHLLLALIPLIGMGTGVLWWIRRASAPYLVLRRGRTALGLVVSVTTAGYLARFIWANDWAIEHGSATLPRPLLALWISALAILASTLLRFAYIDFRSAPRTPSPGIEYSRIKELVTTLLWASTVAIASAIPIMLELRYPAL